MDEEKKTNEKPNCYNCIFRQSIPGDAHSMCGNPQAKVKADAHGIKNGWFWFPFNFDPTWLISCTGFSHKETK